MTKKNACGRMGVLGLLCCCLPGLHTARAQDADTLYHVHTEEVSVLGTRATATTPVAFSQLNRTEMASLNKGRDLPYMLGTAPSVVTTSDAGAGIGYASIRVRGTDATRINVTTNGIPLNDAESHAVFWVNMPDMASSVRDIQVQRGVGTSTNGAGAFGASINMRTDAQSSSPQVALEGSAGSYGTYKTTLKVETGLLHGHWAFSARLSAIGSDGYIDRASSRLKGYFAQAGYYHNDTSLKFITFGGSERTYHAWNYATREEMERYGRTYNSCGYMYTDETGARHYYDDQTDLYNQRHYQLLLNHAFNARWTLEAALHYTAGDGYYQDYKRGRALGEYGLQPYDWQGGQVETSDLVRRKGSDSRFGGGIFSLTRRSGRLTAVLGGGLNRYESLHQGHVLWVANYVGRIDPTAPYYSNDSGKTDGNLYLKADYQLAAGWKAYADLQWRGVTYRVDGANDKYDWRDEGGMQRLDVDERFSFFNPKGGLFWQPGERHRLFASVGVAHKEPTRNNYTDAKSDERPRPERLTDYEVGYNYTAPRWSAGVNLYHMSYRDQLILTGEVNEIGEPLNANVPRSYRMGVELQGSVAPVEGLTLSGHLTLSRNRIRDYVETLYEDGDPTAAVWQVTHRSAPIAFSPSLTGGFRAGYQAKGWQATLLGQYVGRQYMDNSRQRESLLQAYWVADLTLERTFSLSHAGNMTVGITVYNLLNRHYESNGYASSWFTTDPSGGRTRHVQTAYSAQAGRNVLAYVSLHF